MNSNSLFSQFSRQSPKGVLIIYLQLLYKALKVTWILLFLFIQRFSKFSESALIYIYVGLIVVLLFILIRAYLIYKNFVFKIDNGYFVLKEGILKKKNTSVSFDRIQNINFKQNIVQQLINVYEVNIETAGSKDTEIAIKALSFDKAQALKEALSEVKNPKRETAQTAESQQPKPLLKIGFTELLKVSLTENHLQNLLLFLAIVVGILQQLQDVFKGFGNEKKLNDLVEVDAATIVNSVLFFVVLLVALLLVGVISSFVKILLFHFNLTLFIKEKSFNITQGLLTKKTIILNENKIQSITVATNPIKKKLGISFVTFKQAVSGKVKKQQNKLIRIVGCKLNQIQQIKKVLYAYTAVEEKEKKRPNNYFKLKMYIRSFLALLLLNGIAFSVLQTSFWFFSNVLLVPITILLIQLKFNKQFYKLDQELLLIGSGRVETHLTYLPIFKMQNIKMSQTIFQKRRNIVDLVFQTASGKVKIPCIDKQEALSIYNFALYKAETNTQPWM
ncbi:MAG: PH domain-containing protein [Flavobacteriaceae bacterium]|nr:PH domain-containing protein [Flavobacteriaceae bacterium]